MHEFIFNLNLLFYGIIGCLLFIYIRFSARLGFRILKINEEIFPELILGFFIALILSTILGFFGKIGLSVLISAIILYFIYSLKNKTNLINSKDIFFSIIYALVIGKFVHGPSTFINTGLVPGDTFTYASWLSSLAEFPNRFNELMIINQKFGNIFKLGNQGISQLSAIFLNFNFINPIEFMIISVPSFGMISLTKSFQFHNSKNKENKNRRFFKNDLMLYTIPIFALIPSPMFVIESPPILFALAILYDSSSTFLRQNVSRFNQHFLRLFSLYAFYSTKLALAPPFLIKLITKNKFTTSLIYILFFSIVGITVLLGEWRVLPDIFQPSINSIVLIKFAIVILYVYLISSIKENLFVLIGGIALYSISYKLFNSTLASIATILFALKNNEYSIPEKNKRFTKILLIILSFVAIYLSQPHLKMYFLNILILSIFIPYLCCDFDYINKIFISENQHKFYTKYFKRISNFFIFILLLILLTTPVFQYDDSRYPSKFAYLAYSKLKNITKKDNIIFTNQTGDNSDLNGGWNNFSGISGRQFYLSGWFNSPLRYKNEERKKMLEINKNIFKMDGSYCEKARQITNKDLFLLIDNKKEPEEIIKKDGELLYENEKYQIISICKN